MAVEDDIHNGPKHVEVPLFLSILASQTKYAEIRLLIVAIPCEIVDGPTHICI